MRELRIVGITALFMAASGLCLGDEQALFKVRVRSVAAGDEYVGASILMRSESGEEASCEKSAVICTSPFARSARFVLIRVTPATASGLKLRELKVAPSYCSGGVCSVEVFLSSDTLEGAMSTVVQKAKDYRSEGDQNDRIFSLLSPYRLRFKQLNSQSAVCAQYLYAAAAESLCLENAYLTCEIAGDAIEELRAALVGEPTLFESCKVTDARLLADLNSLRVRKQIQERYRSAVVLANTISQSCSGADKFAEIRSDFEARPDEWQSNGVYAERLVRDEALARRRCHDYLKSSRADKAAQVHALDRWEEVVKLGLEVLHLADETFQNALSEIQNARNALL